MICRWLAAAFLLLPLSAVAVRSAAADTRMASVYTRISGEEMKALLQRYGYKAELTKDEGGDPKIMSAASGAKFVVFFYDCNEARSRTCTTIQFSVAYNLDEKVSAATVNDWNREMLYGRLYLDDDGDPVLDHDIILTGGVSEENLKANLVQWESMISDYRKHIHAD